MNRISLIIATYNRGEKLQRTLQSLSRQTLHPDRFDVAVVNNNSTDRTQAIAEEFATKHPWMDMQVLFEARQGLSHARNCGIAHTSGEYVVIMDDDEEAEANFLQVYFDFFESHPDAVGAGGLMLPVYESEPPRWMSRYTEGPIAGRLRLGNRTRPFPHGKFFIGGNMAVRRSALQRFGVFDPELGRRGKLLLAGEEKDLFRRITSEGGKCYYLPRAVIHHIIPPSRMTREYFSDVCRQIGRSERVRTENISPQAYRKRIVAEGSKWCATLVICVGFVLSLQCSKARYLLLMRRCISHGLLEKRMTQQ